MEISNIQVNQEIEIYHTGPSLDLGPLPTFFYFALSGRDSLLLDPFNQPVQFLQGKNIRIFSMTLPGHENDLPPTNAMHVWAEIFAKGENPISYFLEQFDLAFQYIREKGWMQEGKIGIGGLSRGGFMALHAAARQEKIGYVLSFAPITNLSLVKELIHLNLPSFPLPNLTTKEVRIYIGNCDTRVGTKSCIEFAQSLVQASLLKGVRSPQVRFCMYPSIGSQGHGTPPEIFWEGADWMRSCLM